MVGAPRGDDTVSNSGSAYVYQPLELAVEATVDFNPNTLNLKSKGKWITCYVELPDDYDVQDIDIGTVMLNETIPAERGDVQDGILMVSPSSSFPGAKLYDVPSLTRPIFNSSGNSSRSDLSGM